MIKYNLKCSNDHEFESWFSNSNEFDNLNKKKLLECIFCSSKKINKSIMAPMIASTKKKENNLKMNQDLLNEKIKLIEIRKYIENNFENVGKNFSKRVREIYYDREKKNTIYGTTTFKEREELAEEGIDLISVPWVSKDN